MEYAMLVPMFASMCFSAHPGSLRHLRAFVLLASVVATGCHSQTPAQPQKPQQPPPTAAHGAVSASAAVQAAPPAQAAVSAAFAARIKEIAAAGQLAELERPNFSDYRKHFVAVYEATNYT